MLNAFVNYIFVCIFFISLAGCAEIDKALYSVSQSVSDVDRVTGKRTANFTSRETQIKQSNQIVDQLIKEKYLDQNLKINADLSAQDYRRIETIFKRVHAVSHMKDEDWKVFLVPEDSFNAYVTGGTYVVVHQGLLKEVNSDDEIAAVLGHELAHVAANHLYERQAHTIAATLKGSKSVKRDSFHAAFIHEDEEEADSVGILYATLAGYDPYAASRIWKRMYDNQGDFSARLVSHPIYSERYQKTASLADTYEQYYQEDTINHNHAEILKTNEVFGFVKDDEDDLAVGEGGGLASALETVFQGLSTHQKAKQEAMRQNQRIYKIQQVKKALTLLNKKLVDNKTVHISMQYQGLVPLKNLTFIVVVDALHRSYKMPHDITAKETFDFTVSFEEDIQKLLKVGHDIMVDVIHLD